MTDPNDSEGLARKMFLAETAAVREHLAEQEQAATDRAAELLAPIQAQVREQQARDRAEHRATVLREAADFVGNDDDCDCGGCDSCVPNKLAEGLRRLADQAAPAGPSSVFAEIRDERARQDAKFGEQNHPDGTGNKSQQDYAKAARRWCEAAFGSGYGTWADVLAEEVAEANAECDPAKLRAELVQVAAVAAAWIQAIDRRTP
ncbi:hypothetical protein ABZZ79_03390 [Streptomyces sp. NPDC006458]|uniref:hypothetical protein n=1 Tax=Streptomyces sp. NPDC006458 TaxID=3154302 RepID=UPI0033A84D77